MKSLHSSSHFRVLLLFALASPCLPGCSQPTSPRENTLTGEWDYSLRDVKFQSLTCSFLDVKLSLVQAGETFSGTVSGGKGSCNGSPEQVLANSTVDGGIVSADRISFFIGIDDISNTGTRSGNIVNGTATVAGLGPGGTGTGIFTMTRR